MREKWWVMMSKNKKRSCTHCVEIRCVKKKDSNSVFDCDQSLSIKNDTIRNVSVWVIFLISLISLIHCCWQEFWLWSKYRMSNTWECSETNMRWSSRVIPSCVMSDNEKEAVKQMWQNDCRSRVTTVGWMWQSDCTKQVNNSRTEVACADHESTMVVFRGSGPVVIEIKFFHHIASSLNKW